MPEMHVSLFLSVLFVFAAVVYCFLVVLNEWLEYDVVFVGGERVALFFTSPFSVNGCIYTIVCVHALASLYVLS